MTERNGVGRLWDRWGNLVMAVFGLMGMLVGALYVDLRNDITEIRDDLKALKAEVKEIHRWTKPQDTAEGPSFKDAPLGKPQS